MKFKVGDRVKYIEPVKKHLERSGVIIRTCPIIGSICYVIRWPNGFEEHTLAKYLKLNYQKGQQLLFYFMD